MRYQRAAKPLVLDGLEAARAFFAECFAESDPARECLWVAHIDADWNCVHLFRHEGDETGGTFPVRPIIANAALHASAGILLAHNHPSGDPTPSIEDRQLTDRLVAVGKLLGIRVLDHVIIGDSRYVSFADEGWLKESGES